MSRLYYEPRKSPMKHGGDIIESHQTGSVSQRSFNDYLEKVALLVPSEVIAAYLTMFGFVSTLKSESSKEIFLWVIFVACLVLTPLYLNKVADANKPKRNHIIISTIAFIVWAFVMSGVQFVKSLGFNEYDPAIASIVLVLFSIISAIVPLDK
jgi:hypothetical protein